MAPLPPVDHPVQIRDPCRDRWGKRRTRTVTNFPSLHSSGPRATQAATVLSVCAVCLHGDNEMLWILALAQTRANNFPGVCLPLTCANLLVAGEGYAAPDPYPLAPPPLYSGTVYYATPVAPTMYGQGYDSGGYVSGGYYPPLTYPYNGY